MLISIIGWLRDARLFIEKKSELSPVLGHTEWVFPIWLIDFQRQTIWRFALDIWEKAPWFGIGPNTINFLPGADSPLPGDDHLKLIPSHPHNWAVELLAETGIVGVSFVLCTILLTGFYWIRRYAKNHDLAILSLLLISAGYWGSGLFNFSYWAAWWQLSFFLASAIALAMTKHH